jgi:hypothetical protein
MNQRRLLNMSYMAYHIILGHYTEVITLRKLKMFSILFLYSDVKT